jgi:signal transduction histidine kinase
MFRQTRLRLTFQSVSIVMLLSIFFSIIIYALLLREVTRFSKLQRFRIERQFTSLNKQYVATFPADFELNESPLTAPVMIRLADPELETELLHNIQFALIGVNLCVLLIASGFSYIVAGKALQPLQELLENQQAFLSAASHELRTPLTAIQLSSEVALRDPKLKLNDAKKLISENLRELAHLQTLTESILKLQKAEQPLQTTWEVVTVHQILHAALQQVTPLANANQQKIQIEVSGGKLKGSRLQLVEVLVILLDNAIKYSPSKSVITIRQRRVGQFQHIQVCDQGQGINHQELERIFGKFYRSDHSRSKQIPGFGLGLAIAQQIVTNHNGKLTASNVQGSGACFTVELPVG